MPIGWAGWDDEGGVDGVVEVEDGNDNEGYEGDEEAEERGVEVLLGGEMCGWHCLMIEPEEVTLHRVVVI